MRRSGERRFVSRRLTAIEAGRHSPVRVVFAALAGSALIATARISLSARA